MTAAVATPAPTPSRSKAVDDPRRGGRLKVFAREGGRVRFVSDDVAVRDAELVDVAFFDHQVEADAIARACADILTLTGGTAPDQYGWHTLPAAAEPKQFLATLLETARTQVWSRSEAAISEDEAGPATTATLRSAVRRRWTHADDIYFALLVGQGHSAKGIAAELGLSVMNAYKHANRLGLSLSDRYHHETRLRLPSDVLARIDGLAETGGMRRETFLNRWVTKAMRGDPQRYGLVMIG